MIDFNELLNSILTTGISREWFFLSLILVSTILIVMTVGLMAMGLKKPLKKRLKNITSDTRTSKTTKKKIENTLESLEPLLSPNNIKEQESIRHKLMHAGFHQQNALTLFYGIKFLTSIVGILVGIFAYLFYSEFTGNLGVSVMVLSLGIGMFFPNFMLSRIINERQHKMREAIPDSLDLLLVCTESGLGLNAALIRVSQELSISHPEFSDELDTVCAKIKAGMQTPDAFSELILRTGLIEIQGLVSMLAHSSRIGSSIGKTLRDYNEDYRDRRNQAAEEVAAKIPTKMIFPLVLFIWPCFFIVAIGPAILHMMESFLVIK
ncbi:MAG: type II secretion system F family protein [Aliivibrio sp.]|uniref:type II secretion system F family protein n=1 Tax=Aliivibrio sp. TaxID=1872443 RepID=UPI001A455B75|nr:type II secretion system F family protein [Aliivibrio sp.]